MLRFGYGLLSCVDSITRRKFVLETFKLKFILGTFKFNFKFNFIFKFKFILNLILECSKCIDICNINNIFLLKNSHIILLRLSHYVI